jgi:hypothetical protein
MQRNIFGTLAAVALLAGCGSNPEKTLEADESGVDAPANVTVFEEDTHACREKHDRWLMELIARVDRALPQKAVGTVRFESVEAHEQMDGKGLDLLLRFTADYKGQAGVSMFAVGPFDPETCVVGKLKGSVGRNLYDADKHAFDIP